MLQLFRWYAVFIVSLVRCLRRWCCRPSLASGFFVHWKSLLRSARVLSCASFCAWYVRLQGMVGPRAPRATTGVSPAWSSGVLAPSAPQDPTPHPVTCPPSSAFRVNGECVCVCAFHRHCTCLLMCVTTLARPCDPALRCWPRPLTSLPCTLQGYVHRQSRLSRLLLLPGVCPCIDVSAAVALSLSALSSFAAHASHRAMWKAIFA